MKQILNGLKMMHDLKICHRDLKPQNILLKEGTIKIGDLGSSKIMDFNEINQPFVVSGYYRAPELFLGFQDYDFSIDIWSAGCIIFELIAKVSAFKGFNESDLLLEIQQILGAPSLSDLQVYEDSLQIDKDFLKIFKECVKIQK